MDYRPDLRDGNSFWGLIFLHQMDKSHRLPPAVGREIQSGEDLK
jgi:hypothetical protein